MTGTFVDSHTEYYCSFFEISFHDLDVRKKNSLSDFIFKRYVYAKCLIIPIKTTCSFAHEIYIISLTETEIRGWVVIYLLAYLLTHSLTHSMLQDIPWKAVSYSACQRIATSPIYALVFPVISYLQASQPKPCKHLSPPPCLPHVPPTSSSFI
jgi:hypothetical protein